MGVEVSSFDTIDFTGWVWKIRASLLSRFPGLFSDGPPTRPRHPRHPQPSVLSETWRPDGGGPGRGGGGVGGVGGNRQERRCGGWERGRVSGHEPAMQGNSPAAGSTINGWQFYRQMLRIKLLLISRTKALSLTKFSQALLSLPPSPAMSIWRDSRSRPPYLMNAPTPPSVYKSLVCLQHGILLSPFSKNLPTLRVSSR